MLKIVSHYLTVKSGTDVMNEQGCCIMDISDFPELVIKRVPSMKLTTSLYVVTMSKRHITYFQAPDSYMLYSFST